MSSDRGIDLRPYDDADLPAVLDLLQASLAGGPTGRRSAAFFRWKHEANPFGRSLALVATAGDTVVGFRTFLRWRFRVDGDTIAAVRAVDTATHPDFQGRGIFRRLTMAALDAVAADADLVFNTPNEQSLPGYLKMGWTTVGTVSIALRPARPLRFVRLARHATRGQPSGPPPEASLPAVQQVLDDDAAVRGLLEAVRPRTGAISTARTIDYLRWRYVDPPELDYLAAAVWDGGELRGLAIGRPRMRGPLAEFTLSEVLVRSGDDAVMRRLLRMVAGCGCDHVASHLSTVTSTLKAARAGFFSAPGSGIHLVARPLRSAAGPDPTRLGSWALSLGDLELF